MTDFFERALATRGSGNPTEAQSVLLGSLLSDNSPLLAPIKMLLGHVFLTGSPGSGKTRLMAFLLELLLTWGGCIVHVFDLKKDGTRELFAAGEEGAARSGTPVRWFVDAVGRSTHTFNLFLQRFWIAFSPLEKADFIGVALGSSHGLEGYGKQHFGSIAVRILLEVFRRWTVLSWIELDRRIADVLRSARALGLDKAVVLGATQLRNDVNRLAQIPALNHPTSSIDLCSDEPQFVYWSFPGKYAVAGSICRAAIFGVYAGAGQNPERLLWLFVDEFQRAIGNQLELLFTQSRESLALILAAQCLADLRTRDKDYAPTVQSCCRVHWTFNVADPSEQKFMAETSGKELRKLKTTTYGIGELGYATTESRSYSEYLADRYDINQVKMASANPELSIFLSTQDLGFIQYGGFPQVVHTPFHVSSAEHAARKARPWRGPEPGTITTTMPEPEPPPGPRPSTPPDITDDPRKPPRRRH